MMRSEHDRPDVELVARLHRDADGEATVDLPDDDQVIDLQLQAMAFEAALRYAERVLPRSLLEFLA